MPRPPLERPDKVLLTNESVLEHKYGATGTKAIREALERLITADRKRGLTTTSVALDKPAHMTPFKGKPVTKATNERQAKRAIDAIYKASRPDYLILLGAIDVIPHQNLVNPVAKIKGTDVDPDTIAWGDLPYACDAAYDREISTFLEPTRVVGRLPDTVGASDPADFILRIDAAARAVPRSPSDYDDYLGITAEIWKKSSTLNVRAIFGNDRQLAVSPPKGPEWPSDAIRRRMHFINCHGAPAEPNFFGEDKETGDQPVSHSAAFLDGKIASGTVVAAECCYGAELYDPKLSKGQPGIVDTYLSNGAWGFFGSSTVAYGPEDENAEADLICQYFLKHVRAGASLGRAVLEARQDFIRAATPLTPTSLKTVAQFSLMGDPSVHAVRAVESHGESEEADRARRKLTRRRLGLAGVFGGRAASVVHGDPYQTPPDMRRLLQQQALARGVDPAVFGSFALEISSLADASLVRLAKKAAGPGRLAAHVAIGKRKITPRSRTTHLVVVTALELDGHLHIHASYSR